MTELSLTDSLIKARIALLLDRPFYGNLALHLPLKENNFFDTFATDGKFIYYNKEFAKKCSDQDKQFIIAHEVLHNAFFHLIRIGEREYQRWSLAIDYATNAILKKDFNYVPEGGFYDQKFENMTAEEIYNKLPDMNGKGKGMKGGYKRFEGKDMTIEIDKDGNMKINGKDVKPFDEHKPIKGSKKEIDELEKEWAIQVAKAYQQAKQAGKMPAGMNIFIEQLLEPKLDWRNMTRQFIITTAKSDFQYLPPNRRFVHQDMYMPSMTGESLGDIVVIIDNSGSTLNVQQEFFSECNGLLQQYEIDMHLIVCDAEVNDYHLYNKGDTINLKYKGGGGTNLPIAFDEIARRQINPSVVVCITDGYTPWPQREKYPTLWVISKDGVDLKDVPFGMKVKMDE